MANHNKAHYGREILKPIQYTRIWHVVWVSIRMYSLYYVYLMLIVQSSGARLKVISIELPM